MLSLGFIVTPAYADCAGDIATAEDRIASFNTKKSKEGRARAAIALLAKAKTALAEGKKKKCKNLTKKANEKINGV